MKQGLGFWILVSILFTAMMIAMFGTFSYLFMTGWNMVGLLPEISFKQSSGISLILFCLAFLFNTPKVKKTGY